MISNDLTDGLLIWCVNPDADEDALILDYYYPEGSRIADGFRVSWMDIDGADKDLIRHKSIRAALGDFISRLPLDA